MRPASTNKPKDTLHSIRCAGIGERNWQSRDDCAAVHEHIECGICRNDAVVGAAQGDMQLPQRTFHSALSRLGVHVLILQLIELWDVSTFLFSCHSGVTFFLQTLASIGTYYASKTCCFSIVRAHHQKHVKVAAVPAREKRVPKAHILEQRCKTTYDRCFGQMVALTDSPKFILTICMDAFQPFLGQYYQVRLLPRCLLVPSPGMLVHGLL